MAANGYFKGNADGTIDVVCTELEATTVTATSVESSGLTGDLYGRVFLTFGEDIIADGAIPVTYGLVILDSSSATVQTTLAAGSAIGQRLSIVCVDASNTCDVDADFVGTTATLTFTAAGHAVDLVYTGAISGWAIIGNNGATLS